MKIQKYTKKKLGLIGTLKLKLHIFILELNSDFHLICSGDWEIYSPKYNQNIYFNIYTNEYGLYPHYIDYKHSPTFQFPDDDIPF